MKVIVDDDMVKDSHVDTMPPGDWRLTLPATLPDGRGIATLHAEGHPRWFAVLVVERDTATIYGVWRDVDNAIAQLLAMALTAAFMHVLTDEQMQSLLDRMPANPLAATPAERKRITEDWLREFGGQSAVDDPVEYVMALVEHVRALKAGHGPTVH